MNQNQFDQLTQLCNKTDYLINEKKTWTSFNNMISGGGSGGEGGGGGSAGSRGEDAGF